MSSSINGETSEKAAKPRARLGTTEIVTLPGSDSEPENDDSSGEPDGEGGGGGIADSDLLKDFPDDAEHSRLKTSSLALLNLPRFGRHLKRLCLRQNEVTSPIPSDTFQDLKELEELDLYDNRLGPRVTDEELSSCPNLTSLDLSFNNIRHPPRLPSQTRLQVLYLVQNKIGSVEEGELDWSADTITSLELGGNRIRVLENLEKLTKLTELWLGKNKIRALEGADESRLIVQNLDTFANLKILSIQSNRITKLENLGALANLEELYLSHNGLKKIEGLENNSKLRTLDIGNNQIEEIENIAHLSQLEEFWASNNQIQTLKALDTQLRHIDTLETVYLEGNPCQRNDQTGYRRKVMLALPQLKQIDATFVKLA